MNTQNLGAEKIRWNLDLLYAGIDDPAIDQDIAEIVQRQKAFFETYKGNLAEKLGDALTDLSEMSMLQQKLGMYLNLRQSTNVGDSTVKAKIADSDRILSQSAGEHMSFFTIELVAISNETLDHLYISDPIVLRHRPWIEHKRVFKPHLLTEPVEGALTKRSPFGPGAWSEFFEELETDLEFHFHGEKKTLTELLHALSVSHDANERAEALALARNGLNGHFAKYSAQNLYMVAGLGAVERKERGYEHPMAGRNKSNQIPDSVVEILHKAVTEHGSPLARRYYRLKAKLLGLDKLRWSDRNAPMPFSDMTVVPFDEAVATVLQAYSSFSPTLAGLVQKMVAEKRLDVPVVKGKRSGAFNYSIVAPKRQALSFVLLNYLGSNRDVMTLAHELGHAVHGMLAGEAQGPLMAHAPIAYCETASVFGEMTTFHFLKECLVKSGNEKALLALIMGKLDDMINTVIRQIGFSNFERRLHGMNTGYTEWHEPKKLSVPDLNTLWLQTLKELYGSEGDVFTYENVDTLWSYIPHFHTPFYVYGYAFGELLTQSLYAEKERLGEHFEPAYLEMLRSGSTKNVFELLKPFGLDPGNENFWINGINAGFESLVTEAEKLSEKIKPSI